LCCFIRSGSFFCVSAVRRAVAAYSPASAPLTAFGGRGTHTPESQAVSQSSSSAIPPLYLAASLNKSGPIRVRREIIPLLQMVCSGLVGIHPQATILRMPAKVVCVRGVCPTTRWRSGLFPPRHIFWTLRIHRHLQFDNPLLLLKQREKILLSQIQMTNDPYSRN
jgi:hypothetical protein